MADLQTDLGGFHHILRGGDLGVQGSLGCGILLFEQALKVGAKLPGQGSVQIEIIVKAALVRVGIFAIVIIKIKILV